ncbi:transaldolase [Geopyxis carbonaria]|nr:transaldolase [Geopyxis carbonaria]
MSSILAHLQSRTAVDCDTLDLSLVQHLGPFVDCTSNQAIAYNELMTARHSQLLTTAATSARKISAQFPDVPLPELAAELFQVHLSHAMLSTITGRTHVQTNPAYSFSTAATVACARRIIAHMAALGTPRERVCIKIPATWEGLAAIRTLEAEGTACLATTLFTLAQAAVAGEVGATYIAPYVNDLRVHFVPGFVDAHPGFGVCVAAQRWYAQRPHITTQTLPASVISVAEVLRLAGVAHMTIAPPLLAEMARRPWDAAAAAELPSDFDVPAAEAEAEAGLDGLAGDEARWRMRFNAELGGVGVEKLCHAVNIFCDFQKKLEKLAAEVLETV